MTLDGVLAASSQALACIPVEKFKPIADAIAASHGNGAAKLAVDRYLDAREQHEADEARHRREHTSYNFIPEDDINKLLAEIDAAEAAEAPPASALSRKS